MLTCARADVCMHVLLDLALFILTNLKGDCHDFKIVIAIKEPDFGVSIFHLFVLLDCLDVGKRRP